MVALVLLIGWRGVGLAQSAGPCPNPAEDGVPCADPHAPHDHDHVHGHEHDASAWTLGLDGVVFLTFDKQGSLRGETQFISQNWFMGMAAHQLGPGHLMLTGMLSAEPFSVGPAGYAEIFQEGEAFHGLQVTDHQHPHNLFMQLAASWRVPLGEGVSFTLAGGPVGEAALGPVAFMHRPSSSEDPIAPLSHHIFDSTHISNGVVLVGLDRGPFSIEGSVFRGREPDEHRYNIELGALDSWSVRGWFRPGSEWTMQVSYGFLRQPEQLEPGNQRRTNGSVSWLRERESGFTAVTAALGRTARDYSTVHALLVEATEQWRGTSVYGRLEAMTVETEILLFPERVHHPHPGELVDPVREETVGAVRDIADVRGFKVGIGGDVVFYGVPEILQFVYGPSPRSFHLFVRLRPPARGGRMWNATMGQPMGDHMGLTHDPSKMPQ
jgi:hypothetical protein